MARRKHPNSWRDCFLAVAHAGELLKGAGFELRRVTPGSESCYYGWPGRIEEIRVSAHRKGKPNGVTDLVVANITISSEMTMISGGIMSMPKQRLDGLVAGAIGRYFLRIKLGASGVMAAAPVLGTGVFGRGGSSPSSPTINGDAGD